MYLSLLWFIYVCCIIIKYFMYFRGIMVISQWTRDQTAKTDITFELRTAENLRRSIKRKMTLFKCTILFTYWPMMWHWPMSCHDPIRLKFLYIVDRWRGSILVDQKSCVRYIIYMELFSTKPRHYSNRVTIQVASLFKPCGQTAYCWLMTWRNPEHSNFF